VSQVTVTAMLDGVRTTLPALVSEAKTHQISVTAVDQVGWKSVAASSFAVERKPPEVTVVSPLPNTCTNASEGQVSGRATGATAVKITLGSSTTVETNVGSDGAFSTTIPISAEGKLDLIVDAAGAVA